MQDNEIVFTDKDETAVYKTGMVEDPDLTQRLYDSGAQFSGEIVEQTSPFLAIILSWILPIVVFISIGNYMSKRLTDRANGGPNSMIFGMGKGHRCQKGSFL